jgi:hypothetical protein
MSRTPSQTQTPKIDTREELLRDTYICERDLLERKLRELNEKLKVTQLYTRAIKLLEEALSALSGSVSYLEIDKLKRAVSDINDAFREAVENMIYYEIPYDRDIEKFERAFSVKFRSDLFQRVLGVVLVEEGDKMLPAAICTDYSRVWYTEGERDE